MTKHGADTVEQDFIPPTAEENRLALRIPEYTINELITKLSSQYSVRVLTVDKNEPYVIASKENHCIFGEGAVKILVVKE